MITRRTLFKGLAAVLVSSLVKVKEGIYRLRGAVGSTRWSPVTNPFLVKVKSCGNPKMALFTEDLESQDGLVVIRVHKPAKSPSLDIGNPDSPMPEEIDEEREEARQVVIDLLSEAAKEDPTASRASILNSVYRKIGLS